MPHIYKNIKMLHFKCWWVGWALNVAFYWMGEFESIILPGHWTSNRQNLVFLLFADCDYIGYSVLTGFTVYKGVLSFVVTQSSGFGVAEFLKKEWITHLFAWYAVLAVCHEFLQKLLPTSYFPFLRNSTLIQPFSTSDSRLGLSHASSKRTYRSAGTLRRLEAVGISLGAATWHSLFSSLALCPCSVLTSGCRMFCVLEEGNHAVLSLLKLSITQRIHQISISDRLQRLTEPLMYLMINTTCTYQTITGSGGLSQTSDSHGFSGRELQHWEAGNCLYVQ